MLSEEALGSNAIRVENVHERDGILGKGRSEDNHFPILAHLFDKLATVGSHLDENVGDSAFNIYRQHDISMLRYCERTMDKSFIDIQQQSFPTPDVLGLWAKKGIAWFNELVLLLITSLLLTVLRLYRLFCLSLFNLSQ